MEYIPIDYILGTIPVIALIIIAVIFKRVTTISRNKMEKNPRHRIHNLSHTTKHIPNNIPSDIGGKVHLARKKITILQKISIIILTIINPIAGIIYAIIALSKTLVTTGPQSTRNTTHTTKQQKTQQMKEESLIYDESQKHTKSPSLGHYHQTDNIDDFNNFDEKDNPPLFS